MSYTLQDTMNWAGAFIEYSPMNAGTNNEPAVSIASMVRSTILNPPLTWPWNRAIYTGLTISEGTQDYVVPLTDFGFLEKVTLKDADGVTWEIKDIYNTTALGISNTTTGRGQKPAAVAILAVNYGTDVTLRFMGSPSETYTVTLVYQKLALQFGSYGITSVATATVASYVLGQVVVSGATTTYTGAITGGGSNAFVGMTFPITGFANGGNNVTITVTASTATTLVCTTTTQVNEIHAGAAAGGQAAYTGIFTAATFPAGSIATVTGFVTTANDGNFVVISATATRLVLANPNAAAETATAAAFNGNWSPIPDSFMDIFNNLFIAEAFQAVDDWQMSAQYRTRGIAALLAKAEGLSEMQRSAFLQQYLSRNEQMMASQLKTQMGRQASSV